MEFQDFDLLYYSEDVSLKEEHNVYKWIIDLLGAAESFHRDPSPGPKLEQYVKDAGFQNVDVQKYRLPIGPWAKDPHLVRFPEPSIIDSWNESEKYLTSRQKTVGSWNLVQIEEGLEAFSLRLFTSVLGWSAEDVQVLLANVRKDIRNPKIHAQFDL